MAHKKLHNVYKVLLKRKQMLRISEKFGKKCPIKPFSFFISDWWEYSNKCKNCIDILKKSYVF